MLLPRSLMDSVTVVPRVVRAEPPSPAFRSGRSRAFLLTPSIMSNMKATAGDINKGNDKSKNPKQSAVVDGTVGGLVAILKITKEASAVFPPLQSAVGGLLAITEIVSVSQRSGRCTCR